MNGKTVFLQHIYYFTIYLGPFNHAKTLQTCLACGINERQTSENTIENNNEINIAKRGGNS